MHHIPDILNILLAFDKLLIIQASLCKAMGPECIWEILLLQDRTKSGCYGIYTLATMPEHFAGWKPQTEHTHNTEYIWNMDYRHFHTIHSNKNTFCKIQDKAVLTSWTEMLLVTYSLQVFSPFVLQYMWYIIFLLFFHSDTVRGLKLHDRHNTETFTYHLNAFCDTIK